MRTRTSASADTVRFAVVGDVHERWSNATDGAALRALGADHAIFVGDIGNSENLGLVAQIAQLDFPKSVILGNHDAWTSLTARRHTATNKRFRVTEAPADALRAQQLGLGDPGAAAGGGAGDGGVAAPPPRSLVQQQLDVLGEAHVGYREAPIEGGDITVVGGRPFSKGGGSWASIAPFMAAVCGVGSPEESAAKIAAAAAPAAARGDAIVLVAHNGPFGLGARRQDICGVDWKREQGDHGDKDLQLALEEMARRGHPAAAVVFGHMHHTLRGGGLRRMVHVDAATGTTYLNSATVPRVVRAAGSDGAAGATLHHFLVFDMSDGALESARDVWVRVGAPAGAGSGGCGEGEGQPAAAAAAVSAHVESESEVLRTVRGEGGVVKMVWDASEQRWDPVVVSNGAAAAAAAGTGGGSASGAEGGAAVAMAEARGGALR